MLSPKNKVILITGASRGIGKEDALLLATEGVSLALTYHKGKKEALHVAKLCKEKGAKAVLILPLNITNNLSIKKTIKRVVKQYGHISVLINNAGVISWKRLPDQSFEEIEVQLRVNLEGLMKVTKESLPYVREMIINMASAASLRGYPTMISYCASKWGVRGFTQALAEDYPELKVHDVISGGVATQMKNFKGIEPAVVARVIVDFVKGTHTQLSGTDINVRDYAS